MWAKQVNESRVRVSISRIERLGFGSDYYYKFKV
jgi:hypothetical protein